jgi:DNA-directed RNA polymerase subunit RPC12/RpoP
MLDHKCEPSSAKKPSKKSTAVDAKGEPVNQDEEQFSQTCSRCGNVFHDDDEFVCHQNSVCIQEPKYICATCGKAFVSAYRLNSHKVIHDNRKFICDVCGMVFLSKVGKRYAKASSETVTLFFSVRIGWPQISPYSR